MSKKVNGQDQIQIFFLIPTLIQKHDEAGNVVFPVALQNILNIVHI